MSFGFLWLNLALVALRFSFRECSDTSALDKTCNLNRSTTISEMDPTANEVATLKNQMNPNNRAHFDPSAQQLNLSVEVSIWGGVNKTDQREVDLNRRKPFRRRLETINSTSSSEDFVSCLQFKSGQSEIDDTVLNRTHADNFGSDLESRVNEKTTNKALNETCCDDVSSYLETGNQKFEQENFIAVNKSCCSMNVSSNNIEIRKIDDSLNLNQIMNESCCSDITSSNPKFFKSQDTNLLPGVDDSNQTQWSEINGDKINEELIFPLVPSPKTEQRVPQEKRSRFLETRELSRLKTMNQVTLEQQIQGSFEEPHKNRTNLNATRDIPEIQPKTFIGPLVNGTSVNLTGSPNNARTIKHYEKMVFDGQNLNQTEIRSVSERNDQSFSSDKKLLQDSIYGVSTNENVSYFIHENSPQKLVHSVSKNETNPFLNLKHVREKISPTITSRYNELSKRTLVQNISSENEEPFLSDESSKRKSSNSQRALAERGGNIDSFERSDLQWPVKRSAEIMGDLILGGLMMVHEREDTEACGPVMPQGGIQALETMLYTLDKINAATDLFKVSLGAHILDDCDKDTYGLEMALDFIKGSLSNIEDGGYQCNKTQVKKVISGVVGAASSVTSIQVANLLRLFKIPQVSFFSTSPELSNKQRFEYFSRTIPSDEHQVRAMVEVVRKMQWSYVSIIYEESNYGVKAFEELETQLGRFNICIAVKEKLVKDSGVADESAYNEIVYRLQTKPRAKGVIIFGSDQEVAGVMKAVRRLNVTGNFSWVGSDGWSARALVSDGNEKEVEGTLSVQPQANPVKGFEEYFLNLTVENNKRNPWFVEFWEAHFNCRYPNSSLTPYNGNYTKMCTTKEKLTRETTAFENQLQFVSDAVMAFAYAFKDMHRDLCHNESGLCEAMNPSSGPELLKYLRNVSFTGLSGDHFRFDLNGDGPARYNIIHYKRTSETTYEWVKVGEYIEGELHLNMSEIRFSNGQQKVPESVCSLPCELGEAKKYVEGESCCWHCFNCSQYQIRSPTDETQCLTCPEGHKPDARREVCLEIPAVYLKPSNGWAIGAMSFSAVGILFTLFNVSVFLRYNDTPVVKAAGRELSYVLLAGILLCFSMTFLLIIKPTDLVCSIQRFGVGFCFTIVYSALLTKTNRIARIFNAGKRTAKRPGYITPSSQLLICSGMCSVQILINAVWMAISPARAIHHYPSREHNILVCSSFTNASYMIAFSYPITLVMVCTIYAVLTRNIPEAFNESKHIGFTMYTTCVIWLAFIPLYFGTGNSTPLRITTMSIAISLSASVTIVCLFSPKLYIILFRPDQNVRQSMMPSKYSGTVKTGASTSVMAAAVAVSNTHPPLSSVIDIEMKSDLSKRNSVPLPQNLVSKGVQTEATEPASNGGHLENSLERTINKTTLSSASSNNINTPVNNNYSILDKNKFNRENSLHSNRSSSKPVAPLLSKSPSSVPPSSPNNTNKSSLISSITDCRNNNVSSPSPPPPPPPSCNDQIVSVKSPVLEPAVAIERNNSKAKCDNDNLASKSLASPSLSRERCDVILCNNSEVMSPSAQVSHETAASANGPLEKRTTSC